MITQKLEIPTTNWHPQSHLMYRQCADWAGCGGVLLGTMETTNPQSAGTTSHGMCGMCKDKVLMDLEASMKEMEQDGLLIL